MWYGIDGGFDFWWVIPLLCIAMMLLCMGSTFGRHSRWCGGGWRRHQQEKSGTTRGHKLLERHPVDDASHRQREDHRGR